MEDTVVVLRGILEKDEIMAVVFLGIGTDVSNRFFESGIIWPKGAGRLYSQMDNSCDKPHAYYGQPTLVTRVVSLLWIQQASYGRAQATPLGYNRRESSRHVEWRDR